MTPSTQLQFALQERPSERICPYCRSPLGEAPSSCCSDCALALHDECAAELKVCPSFGCKGRLSSSAEIDRPSWRLRPMKDHFQPVDQSHACILEMSDHPRGPPRGASEHWTDLAQPLLLFCLWFVLVVNLSVGVGTLITLATALFWILIRLALPLIWRQDPFERPVVTRLKMSSKALMIKLRTQDRNEELSLTFQRQSRSAPLLRNPRRHPKTRQVCLEIDGQNYVLPLAWNLDQAHRLIDDVNRALELEDSEENPLTPLQPSPGFTKAPSETRPAQ